MALRRIILRVRAFLRWETEDRELLQSVSHKVMGTTLGAYVIWHLIATLGWPQVFSPSLFLISFIVIATAGLAWMLLENYYLLAQVIWFLGLGTAILLSYSFYTSPDVLFLLAFFPIMSEVMLGIIPTVVLEGLIILAAFTWHIDPLLPSLPPEYQLAVVIVTVASAALGWGILDNLISSIDAASYHYKEALSSLAEAREHRAEISVLLNEVNKANYQLDRLNRMLSFARAKADEAREERDRFAMAVSHELRSPLNFIIGFSDLMVNSPETYGTPATWPSGLYDDVKEIYKSSTHLMSLINDILDMGKMDAQQMLIFKEKIDIEVILEDVREMVHSSVESKGLKLIIDIEPDLPPVFADRTRIRQVLLNLVTNAMRFTKKGNITLSARRKTADFLQVEVRDTGTGIAKDDLPKVFAEFRQVGNVNWQRAEGTGLGLAIGRRFIQLHGGEMDVESELGKGSNFFFTIPFHQPADDLEVISDGNGKVTVPIRNEGDEKTPLLLILANDVFSARVFAELITGYKVTLLTDPNQLYQVTATAYPRAVIIDDVLVGEVTVKEFLAHPPYDVPVITLTIPVSLQNRDSLPVGVKDYLVKPVSRQVLMQVVAQLDLKIRTILVVDDDPSMARFVTQSLHTSEDSNIKLPDGLNILVALNGQEALNYLRVMPVGVVLLDLDLTDMNGLTLLNQMQQDQDLRQIPVVIISASDPSASFGVQSHGDFNVMVGRQLNRRELADMVNAALREVLPVYGEMPEKDGEAEALFIETTRKD
jgi:signal transduction histidine kinase/CheY-like chemotaxis protein